ncbi:MAG TPA: cytochrome c oxidase subunit 3 family protein [Opitutaceae bacterium]|nr:cytochrome c oxidase subunit 3 family protein [Opitutaceae bacterium]
MSEASTLPAIQFETIAQQREASQLGMWVFLATEVMFFGGLFLGYVYARWHYPTGFTTASHELNLVAGSINTAVLLASSFFMALAVLAAEKSQRVGVARCMRLTALLGLVFLAIKGFEYHEDYTKHLIPNLNFQFDGPLSTQVELFFWLYFSMTLLHAIHVTVGIVIIGVMSEGARRARHDGEAWHAVEIIGLYWHFVDVVWVFLFPLLYLIGSRT